MEAGGGKPHTLLAVSHCDLDWKEKTDLGPGRRSTFQLKCNLPPQQIAPVRGAVQF